MKRWNDKLRLMELIEIDKQSHKMIVAWLLCQLAGRGMSPAQRLALEEEVVEGGIFDYLFRLVITDIKPPILYRIKENPAHYQRLAEWAITEVEPHLRPLSEPFWERFVAYASTPARPGLTKDILAAAHLYASAWEFRLLRHLNEPFDDELADIERSFARQLTGYCHLAGMRELVDGLAPADTGKDNASLLLYLPGLQALVENRNTAPAENGSQAAGYSETPLSSRPALSRFANLCGQLRFQKRWSQTPRTPETSVMGHMFIVGCYAYFLSISLGACPARRVNSFFSGLFHDLPELLTRDIISPVKKSFEGLGQIIKEYEENELSRRVLTPLAKEGYKDITERLGYYLGLDTGSEFDDTIVVDGKACKVDFHTLQGSRNNNDCDPKDGEALKVCDILAAYIEAYTAMRNGITSDQIQQAFWRMREQNAKRMLGNMHIGALFTDFD